MKFLILTGLVLSLSAQAQTSYAPNDGTSRPGNPGTGLEASAASEPLTKHSESVNRSNTSVTPVPEDTDDLTLRGKAQTEPYRTPETRQSQESSEEELDYRVKPGIDHSEENETGNP